ncbi:MAG: IS110 family transposase [Alphaproteobacteria bacterium]|nr:IS110 family transposase [Alphaproteobacteria bacterium]
MDKISIIGLDLAKGVFQVHGIDADGEVAVRRQLRRAQVLGFFARLEPCLIGMEACATSHYWAREMVALGHEVRLIPPAHVKPYVRRGRKNDANDAAAICEALQSKRITVVPVKSPEQQAGLVLHRARNLLVTQRTMLANAVRSHLAEFGTIEAQGEKGLGKLIVLALDANAPGLPAFAREGLAMLAAQLREAEAKIDALNQQIRALHQSDEASRRVATIPGIGPHIASALVTAIGHPQRFSSGRDLSAWLGLVPSQNSTGGKTALGPITKTGDRYLRSLLVLGATAMLRRRNHGFAPWLDALLGRMSARKATVALANKMARIVWAILVKGGIYQPPQVATAA